MYKKNITWKYTFSNYSARTHTTDDFWRIISVVHRIGSRQIYFSLSSRQSKPNQQQWSLRRKIAQISLYFIFIFYVLIASSNWILSNSLLCLHYDWCFMRKCFNNCFFQYNRIVFVSRPIVFNWFVVTVSILTAVLTRPMPAHTRTKWLPIRNGSISIARGQFHATFLKIIKATFYRRAKSWWLPYAFIVVNCNWNSMADQRTRWEPPNVSTYLLYYSRAATAPHLIQMTTEIGYHEKRSGNVYALAVSIHLKEPFREHQSGDCFSTASETRKREKLCMSNSH